MSEKNFMNRMHASFWDFFDSKVSLLFQREPSFRKIFSYLDSIDRPIVIVESGCVRSKSPWTMTGEGQSTVLFDLYIEARGDGSEGYSVDLEMDNVRVARDLTKNISVSQGDSVAFLNKLSMKLESQSRFIDLLYLDSFDVDYNYWFPSAAHHLKELLAAKRSVTPSTLVVIDDCPINANLIVINDKIQLDKFYKPIVGGKGRLVAEYAEQVGATMYFSHYQHGWLGF